MCLSAKTVYVYGDMLAVRALSRVVTMDYGERIKSRRAGLFRVTCIGGGGGQAGSPAGAGQDGQHGCVIVEELAEEHDRLSGSRVTIRGAKARKKQSAQETQMKKGKPKPGKPKPK